MVATHSLLLLFWCITFSVICSSLFPSRLTLVLFHPVEFPCVWARTLLYFWFFFTRGVTRFFVYSSNCYSFWGTRRLQHENSPPPKSWHFLENLRFGSSTAPSAGRPAQGFSPTKTDTTTTSISSSAPLPPTHLNLGFVL